jgi:hypothetical protein
MTMPDVWTLLSTPIVDLLGWTLLHFVGQGALLSTTAGSVRAWLRAALPGVALAWGLGVMVLAGRWRERMARLADRARPSRPVALRRERPEHLREQARRLRNQAEGLEERAEEMKAPEPPDEPGTPPSGTGGG